MAQAPSACMPVSYTHLDVYKRQVPVQREFRRPIAYDVDYVYQLSLIHI